MIALVWHYTNGLVIDDILSDGVIKLATAGVQRPERPAAWFSTNPTWDASANRGNMTLKKREYQPGVIHVNLSKDIEETPFDPAKMDEVFKGRFRIGVIAEAASHGWESFKKLSGMDKAVARALERTKYGDPTEWRASFQPVERKQWRTVEKLESGLWIRYADLDPIRGSSLEGGRWGRS
jgi:hypothetical protein